MVDANLERDKELNEIKTTAEKMAGRRNMRFVLNRGKIEDFWKAGAHDDDEQEVQSDPYDDGPVLNT